MVPPFEPFPPPEDDPPEVDCDEDVEELLPASDNGVVAGCGVEDEMVELDVIWDVLNDTVPPLTTTATTGAAVGVVVAVLVGDPF